MRRLLSIVAVAAGMTLTACGEEEAVSDARIVEALELEASAERPVYSIGGDPFCEVDQELLNDASEVEQVTSGSGDDLVITNAEQSVGVQAVPPFDPRCERRTRRALDRLAPE